MAITTAESLGSLLELLHCAHERTSCLEAEFRDWTHPPPSYELVLSRDESHDARGRWRGAGPWPKKVVRTRRVWFVAPDRLRVEIARNQALERLGVRDGLEWWRWDELDGATAGDAGGIEGPLLLPPLLDPPLLNPARLLAGLRLEPTGVGVRAGREVILARAWPRESPRARGALSYELEFDAEHGTMLRRAASEDGRLFQVTEARQVRYGGEIDVERFVFVAPDGRPAHSVEEYRPNSAPTPGIGNDQSPSLALKPQSASTVWLTGLPAAGKTTLAYAARDAFARRGEAASVVDGDSLRGGLSSDLGLSPADRGEQARRTSHVAALLSSAGVVAIVALVSPYAEDRRRAREIHDERHLPFFEVWVDTPLEICQRRDPKGLYAQAQKGELHGLTGVDAPYEPPEAPEMRVAGDAEDPQEVAARIVELLAASPGRVMATAPSRA